MRCTNLAWVALAALVLVAAPGCKRTVLNQQKTVDVSPGSSEGVVIDAIGKEQKVKVEFKSEGAPVTVAILSKAEDDKSGTPLAKVANKETDTVEATVPADTEVVVRIFNNSTKKASVQLKMTN